MNTRATGTITPTGKLHGDPVTARRMKKWVGLAVAVVLLFSLLNVYLNLQQEELPSELEGVVTYDDLVDQVVEGPIEYAQHPPAGGVHAALPQLCGFYRVPIQDEHAVASLATGAVWVAYQPGLPSGDVEDIWNAVKGEYDVIAAPYEGLASPVVLTAWGRQLTLDEIDSAQITMFAAVYQNRDWAPASEETCSKGVGLPQP